MSRQSRATCAEQMFLSSFTDQRSAKGRLMKSPALQYLGLFLLITVALFAVLATPQAEQVFVAPFTRGLVDACAAVIGMFDNRVQAAGDILRFADGHGAVQVLAGCNAVEVWKRPTAAAIRESGATQQTRGSESSTTTSGNW